LQGLEPFVGVIEEGGENLSFSQACSNPAWIQAMVAEYKSIMRNNTWQLVSLPPGIRPISSKWVYKIKHGHQNQPNLYKARVVARGNEQIHSVNFQETFAPTIRWESIQLMRGGPYIN
jgi:hypothetical protein